MFWHLKAEKKTPDTLRALFKEYEELALNVLWNHPEGLGSGAVWKAVNKMLAPKTISRASIIFFLNRLVDHDIVDYDMDTGKGGYHRVYSPAMKWSELEDLIIYRFIEKLMLIFPAKKIHSFEQLTERVPA